MYSQKKQTKSYKLQLSNLLFPPDRLLVRRVVGGQEVVEVHDCVNEGIECSKKHKVSTYKNSIKLISLIYTKLSVVEILTILEEHFTKQNQLNYNKCQTIINLTGSTLKQNYFNNIYSHDKVLSMPTQIFSLIVDIFSKLYSKHILNPEIYP